MLSCQHFYVQALFLKGISSNLTKNKQVYIKFCKTNWKNVDSENQQIG